ncbi:MAG: glycosyltransferase [Spirulinaceae cyanobacterium SM2_1_0]|nr:glycosyltransferase [Spirulinaceae cyanobacterium SM2_1_0]
MKFTIVITTYNRLALLKRAIARSLEQTVPCEVVVVDDCSQDETEAYVNKLSAQLQAAGDHRLIYHRNTHNLGHSQSVNAGVQKASGDWIKALDDDDYLALDCIEVMRAAIALRPEAVICSCRAAQVDEQEQQLSLTDCVGAGEICYVPQADIHRGMLLEQIPFGTPVQVAFRRDAFLRSGGWDSSLDGNFDDIDSWVKIAQFGDALFINRCLAYRTIWLGASNRRLSLIKRLNTHIMVKRKIHALVAAQYRHELPSVGTVERYLKLHWALVALRQGAWRDALRFSARAAWSPQAWYLLLQRKLHRRRAGLPCVFAKPLEMSSVLSFSR